MTSRSPVANAAAESILSCVSRSMRALVGFDGFIDSIIHMVDTRHDMSPAGYTRFTSIQAFARRCQDAAGRSTNIEQVLIEDRFGGNGPLMAGALARLGADVSFIGAIGDGQVHPVFQPLAGMLREAIPVGAPSTTDCLEFDDGKLMFNNTRAVQAVTWNRIVERVGIARLVRMVDESNLLGIVNWSLLGGVPGIWRGLAADVWPKISARSRLLFVDLSDPAKRTNDDIEAAMAHLLTLEHLEGLAVVLGLNLAESERIARVMGVDPAAPVRVRTTLLRERLGLHAVVIHTREAAAGATATDEQWFDGPFTEHPRLSTGAGDHFNAGFAFGMAHGRPLAECLAYGCGVSGAYVRDARSPDIMRVSQLLGVLGRDGRVD